MGGGGGQAQAGLLRIHGGRFRGSQGKMADYHQFKYLNLFFQRQTVFSHNTIFKEQYYLLKNSNYTLYSDFEKAACIARHLEPNCLGRMPYFFSPRRSPTSL